MPVIGRRQAAQILGSFKSDPTIVEALLDDDPNNDVEATIKDGEKAAGVSPYVAGRHHKVRGGGVITDAVMKLIDDAEGVFGRAKRTAEEAVVTVIEKTPTIVKSIAAGTAVKYAVNHPSLFANIVDAVRNTTMGAIRSAFESEATWAQYSSALQSIATSVGGLAVDVTAMAAQPSPGTAILIALSIMKYRASKSTGGSVVELIKEDANVLKTAAEKIADNAMSAAVGQYSAFLKAYAEESEAAPLATLKEIAVRAKTSRPSGEGAVAMSNAAAATGAPAAQQGMAEDMIAVVPAGKQKPIRKALDKIAKSKLPSDEQKAASALLALSEDISDAAPSAASKEKVDGGRRSKKTRRAPKRRVTRRRKVTKVTMPTFVY